MYNTQHYSLLKLFAILCIVFNHGIRYGWPPFKILTNDFQVPLLFFASGFVFSFCIYDLQKYLSIGELITKKLRRLLLPYACVLAFWFLPLFFLFGDARYDGRNPLYILLVEYPFGVNADALWFLMALFITYIFAYIGRETYRYAHIQSTPKHCAVIAAGLVLVHLASPLFPTQFHVDRAALYGVHFFAGYALNIWKHEALAYWQSHRILPRLVLCVVGIYIIDACCGFLASDPTPDCHWFWIGLLQMLELCKQFCLIGILCIGARTLIQKYPAVMQQSLIRYLESRSFDIYLYHWPVLLILLDRLPMQDPLLKALTASMGSLLIALLTGEIVRKWRRH